MDVFFGVFFRGLLGPRKDVTGNIIKEIHGCFLLLTQYETPVGVSKDPRKRNVYVFFKEAVGSSVLFFILFMSLQLSVLHERSFSEYLPFWYQNQVENA